MVGVVAAAAACGAIGLCIGLVRWATRAPAAVVSLAAALVVQAVGFKQIGSQGPVPLEEGLVDGSGLPVLAALGFTALATQLLLDAGLVRHWEPFDTRLLIASLLAVCLLLAHGLDRLLAPR